MATQVLMPQLGMGMFNGTIVRWIVADGATVKRRDDLLEIQTEKVVQTLDAPADGVLQQVATEGETVPVRNVIGYILQAGEARVGAPVPAPANRGSVAVAEPGRPAAAPAGEVRASPIARRLAAEHKLDLTTIIGSGPENRIGEKDVLAALEARSAQSAPALSSAVAVESAEGTAFLPTPTVAPAIADDAEVQSISGIRQVIFERMANSARTVARVTEFTEVDATVLVELRTRLKAEMERRLGLSCGYNDLLILIAARALSEHPLLNATYVNGEIRLLPHVNVGLAVDTQRGLVVPVVRKANGKGLTQIVQDVRALVERAQAGTSLLDDFSGGTFTITNLGMHEIDGFTPIVNLPEAAILGVGRIVAKPAVYRGEIAVRQMMTLSLSFDHRLVDGAPAARFLQRVKHLIEEPNLLLL